METVVITTPKIPFTSKRQTSHTKPCKVRDISVADIVSLIDDALKNGRIRYEEVSDALDVDDASLAALFKQRLNLEDVSLKKIMTAIEGFEDSRLVEMMEESDGHDSEIVSWEEVAEALKR